MALGWQNEKNLFGGLHAAISGASFLPVAARRGRGFPSLNLVDGRGRRGRRTLARSLALSLMA